MNFRQSTLADVPALKDLWHKSFQDPLDYIDFYFSNRFKTQNVVVLLERDRIIGMIHLLPCTLAPNQKALYWYAVAIHPEFRGKGAFTHFAKEVIKQNQLNGFANLCRPAEGLFSLYERIGFGHTFYCNEIAKINCQIIEKIKFTRCNVSDFLNYAQKKGDVTWDRGAIEYALRENMVSGGVNLGFHFQGEKYFATALQNSDCCYTLTNTNISSEVFNQCFNGICEYLGCKNITLREYGTGTKAYALTDYPEITKESSVFFTLE